MRTELMRSVSLSILTTDREKDIPLWLRRPALRGLMVVPPVGGWQIVRVGVTPIYVY